MLVLLTLRSSIEVALPRQKQTNKMSVSSIAYHDILSFASVRLHSRTFVPEPTWLMPSMVVSRICLVPKRELDTRHILPRPIWRMPNMVRKLNLPTYLLCSYHDTHAGGGAKCEGTCETHQRLACHAIWGERTAVFKILKRLAGRGASGGLRLTGPGRACSVSTVISFGDSDVVEHCDWQ